MDGFNFEYVLKDLGADQNSFQWKWSFGQLVKRSNVIASLKNGFPGLLEVKHSAHTHTLSHFVRATKDLGWCQSKETPVTTLSTQNVRCLTDYCYRADHL